MTKFSARNLGLICRTVLLATCRVEVHHNPKPAPLLHRLYEGMIYDLLQHGVKICLGRRFALGYLPGDPTKYRVGDKVCVKIV